MKKFLVLLLTMVLPVLLCACNLQKDGKINIKHVSKIDGMNSVTCRTAKNGRIILDMSEGPAATYSNVNLGPRDVNFDFKSLK